MLPTCLTRRHIERIFTRKSTQSDEKSKLIKQQDKK